MSELDEGALRAMVERALDHDPDAWECLYRHSYRRLYSYARRRLPTSEAAEDAVSETLLRAIERSSTFTWRGAGFDAWLYGILRNVVHESHRRRGRDERSASVGYLFSDDISDPIAEIVDAVDAEQDEMALRSAFATLSDTDREVLELRVVGGLSAEEVGSVIGKRPGAVRTAQSRALDRLRQAMEHRRDA